MCWCVMMTCVHHCPNKLHLCIIIIVLALCASVYASFHDPSPTTLRQIHKILVLLWWISVPSVYSVDSTQRRHRVVSATKLFH